MSTDSATRGSKAQRVGTQQVTRLFDGSMDDDVTAQPACNNLRYRRVVLADHLLAGRLDDGLGGVRERASDNDLTNIKQRAHDEGNRGESFSKALDDLLGARVSVGGRFEHPLGADAAIRAAGLQNAMQGFTRYQPLSQEGIIASQPDMVVISQDGVNALGGEANLWKLPGLAQTPAGRHKQLLAIDDMALLGFSVRTPEAIRQLRAKAEQLP